MKCWKKVMTLTLGVFLFWIVLFIGVLMNWDNIIVREMVAKYNYQGYEKGYFALMLLVMSLMALPFVSTSSPEFVVIAIAMAVNGITVTGSWMYLHAVSKKTHK